MVRAVVKLAEACTVKDDVVRVAAEQAAKVAWKMAKAEAVKGTAVGSRVKAHMVEVSREVEGAFVEVLTTEVGSVRSEKKVRE